MVKIGIIGGSGLDNPDIIKDAKDLDVNTAYGKPSSNLKVGKIGNVDVVIIARHGRKRYRFIRRMQRGRVRYRDF